MIEQFSTGLRGTVLGLLALVLSACQTAPPANEAARPEPLILRPVYSGTFIWDTDRPLGDLAVQCIRMALTKAEKIEGGMVRFTGKSRYVTGQDNAIDFVDTELLLDPETLEFTLIESNPTNHEFVTNGFFQGSVTQDRLFLTARWISAENGVSGLMSLRAGTDAPCALDAPV